MKIIKTAQFGHSPHGDNDLEDTEGHGFEEGLEGLLDGLNDLTGGEGDEANHDHGDHLGLGLDEDGDMEDGGITDLSGEHQFPDDADHLGEFGDEVENLTEDHPDGDLSFELELDAPNDLSHDLPVDLHVDQDALEGHEHGDPVGVELGLEPEIDGFDDDSEYGDDFDGLSFDGKADGHVDFDHTNDTQPDDEDHYGDFDFGDEGDHLSLDL